MARCFLCQVRIHAEDLAAALSQLCDSTGVAIHVAVSCPDCAGRIIALIRCSKEER